MHIILYNVAVLMFAGDVLTGKVTCQRDRKDVRALTVTISVLARKLKFILT